MKENKNLVDELKKEYAEYSKKAIDFGIRVEDASIPPNKFSWVLHYVVSIFHLLMIILAIYGLLLIVFDVLNIFGVILPFSLKYIGFSFLTSGMINGILYILGGIFIPWIIKVYFYCFVPALASKQNRKNSREIAEQRKSFLKKERQLIKYGTKIANNRYQYNNEAYELKGPSLNKEVKKAINKGITEKKYNQKKNSETYYYTHKGSLSGRAKNKIVSFFADTFDLDTSGIRCTCCDWSSSKNYGLSPDWICSSCGSKNYVAFTGIGSSGCCTRCGSNNIRTVCPKCGGRLK
ncbi:MAG: hypothetical protein ACI4SK_06050 [Christensenellales bacterium]